MVHRKKNKKIQSPFPLSHEGECLCFPFGSSQPFFPKVRKHSQTYKLVSIFTWTIYVYPRARALCEKKAL